MNIVHLIRNQARGRPFQPAVIFPETSLATGYTAYSHLTFAQLENDSNYVAQKFRDFGLTKGMKILLFVRPSLEFSLLTFAVFKVGAVPILIDPGMGVKNLLRATKDVRPDAILSVPEVLRARFLFRRAFASIKLRFSTAIRSWDPWVIPMSRLLPMAGLAEGEAVSFDVAELKPEDLAAILFTSGGTGKPKGVVYTHGIFATQIELLRDIYYAKTEGEKDLPGFPLFSLMTIAMGVTSVIPRMDPTKPAQADPKVLVNTIRDQGVTTVGGSPAIWERVADYCLRHEITLPSVRSVVMFGAPVASVLHEKFAKILPNGSTYTPYGATECLPVCHMKGQEVQEETARLTYSGKGTCVGLPVPGVQIRIIAAQDNRPLIWGELQTLGPLETGEILVKGPQVTPAYYGEQFQTTVVKIQDPEDGKLWHRMGDVGYLDHRGRLWFCGRKAHRVWAYDRWFDPIAVEQPFVQHPDVRKAALIAWQDKGRICPAIVIEREDRRVQLTQAEKSRFLNELKALGQQGEQSLKVTKFFLHERFPVDIRHNIKIDRLALQKQFASGGQHPCL